MEPRERRECFGAERAVRRERAHRMRNGGAEGARTVEGDRAIGVAGVVDEGGGGEEAAADAPRDGAVVDVERVVRDDGACPADPITDRRRGALRHLLVRKRPHLHKRAAARRACSGAIAGDAWEPCMV